MAHFNRRGREPPGGHDTVSALLQNSTPARHGQLSRARAKEEYAAELRAQMAEQLGNKQHEKNMYHSRPAAQGGRGPSPERFVTAEPDRFGMPREELHHPSHPAPGPPPQHQQSLYEMPEHHQPMHQPFHQTSPGHPQYQPAEPQYQPSEPPRFNPPGQQYSPPRNEYSQQQSYQHQPMQHHTLPPMPDYTGPPDYSPPRHMPPPPMPHIQINPHPPGLHMYEQSPPQHTMLYPEHQVTADLWAQQRGPPPASNAGILAFLRTESKQEGRKAEKVATYRAELQAQMQQSQETRKKLKADELAQDRRMLDALRTSPPNRHINIHGGGSPPPHPGVPNQNTGASMSAVMGGGGGQLSTTAHPPAMAALGDAGGAMYGMYRETGEGRHVAHASLQENESAAGNRQHSMGHHHSYVMDGSRPTGFPGSMQQPGPPQAPAAPSAAIVAAANGGVVPRGVLVNVESSLADTPTFHFKSDKAFLTTAELASRTAAATDLQASLQAQIAEKKTRKDAEHRAERERDAAEMRKLQREQEELAQKQREDLECERKPAENTSAQDQVEEAWRKAQQEAGSRRGRHGSGRHGSPTHGASTGGGGGAPSQHAAVTGLRESRSRSRSPGRDGGGGAHVFSDRGPGGHARVGFADSHAAGYDRGYERGPSGHHGGFQGGSGAGQRPLSSRLPEPGAAQHGHDSVSQKLEQIRAEMYSDNDQLRLQLAARNADVNSLLDRAVQYERQSRVAQDELETVRLQMHAAATTRSELDTLPENADSTFMSATAHTPAFSMHPTVQQGFLPDLNPSRKTQGNLHSGGGELPAAGYSYPVGAASSVPHPHRGERMAGRGAPEREHHTQRSGFLGDLPPTAARQRALAVENPTPKRHASPSEELEEPLVAHTRFIPLPGARQPTNLDPHSSHHHTTAHSPTGSATGELCAASTTIVAPWNSSSRIPGRPQLLQSSRFERVQIPPAQHRNEGRHGMDPPRLAGDPRDHGICNPPIYIDLAEGCALDEGDVLPADSSFLDEGGLHMMNSDRLAMLEGLQLQGDVKSSVEVLDAFLDGFVNQGNASMPLYSSVKALPPNKVLEASEERSRQQFAMRPSETSVQGMTLQEVNETSAAALHTMTEAQEVLGAASGPRHPLDTRAGSQGHTALDANSLSRAQDDLVRATSNRDPTPTREHEGVEAGLNGAAVDTSAAEGVVVDELGHWEAPQMHEKVKSRYDEEASDDSDNESAISSDSERAEEMVDGAVESVQQRIEHMHVADGAEQQARQQVGVSAETLESVELEGSENDSSDQVDASDDEGALLAGGK